MYKGCRSTFTAYIQKKMLRHLLLHRGGLLAAERPGLSQLRSSDQNSQKLFLSHSVNFATNLMGEELWTAELECFWRDCSAALALGGIHRYCTYMPPTVIHMSAMLLMI